MTEEVMEWMHHRQVDIQTELQKENVTEVARFSSLVFTASPHFDGFPIPPNASREHSSFECHDPVTGRTARSEAKNGLRGHRLGEASNPGRDHFSGDPRLGVEPCPRATVVDSGRAPLGRMYAQF